MTALVTASSGIGENAASTSVSTGGAITVVGGTSHLLVCMIGWAGDPGALGAFTWGAQSLTQFGVTQSNGGAFAACFYLLNPTPGASTLSGSWANNVTNCPSLSEWSGVNIATPLANLTAATGIGSPSSVTTPTSSGDAALDYVVGLAMSINTNTGQTSLAVESGGPSGSTFGLGYGLASGSSVTDSWSFFGSGAWVDLGVAIKGVSTSSGSTGIIGLASSEW